MARDYVTIREEERDGETVWTFTSVTHERLKSAPARVTRIGDRYTVLGAAWGAPIAKVRGRRSTAAPGGPPSSPATAHGDDAAWSFWTLDWGTPTSGEHAIRSRAYDKDGNVQPTPQDPSILSRRTIWENNGQITRSVQIP